MKIASILTIFSIVLFTLAQSNYCLRFYGNGQNDIDRVKIPIDNPHRPLDFGESFTIEFQLKATLQDNPMGGNASEGYNDDWTLGHVIIDRDIFGPGDHGDYGISLAGGRIAFGVNNGSQSYTIISNTNIADGNWHHVAITRNHFNGEMSIFINGQLDKTFVSGVTGDISYRDGRSTNWPNDPFLVIGAEKHDYDNTTYPSFNGMIDEIRFSSTARYNTNYSPQIRLTCDQSTIALYHLDEGQGNTIYDACNPDNNLHQGSIHYGGNPAGPVWMINDLTPTSLDFITNTTPPALFVITYSGELVFIQPPKQQIVIFEPSGKIIYIGQEQMINIQHLPSGLYMIRTGNTLTPFVKVF